MQKEGTLNNPWFSDIALGHFTSKIKLNRMYVFSYKFGHLGWRTEASSSHSPRRSASQRTSPFCLSLDRIGHGTYNASQDSQAILGGWAGAGWPWQLSFSVRPPGPSVRPSVRRHCAGIPQSDLHSENVTRSSENHSMCEQ